MPVDSRDITQFRFSHFLVSARRQALFMDCDKLAVIEISMGELCDRLTILQIKRDRITDPAKRKNIQAAIDVMPTPTCWPLLEDLRAINEAIWDHENTIRKCEAKQRIGATFIKTARAIYRDNDRRAELKRQIDVLYGSPIVEEKSYQ